MYQFWCVWIVDMGLEKKIKINILKLIIIKKIKADFENFSTFSFARRLKESLNFWKISTNSRSGGGLARIESIPSPRSFFFDFRDRLRFSSSRNAAAACCSRAMNFSMSSKHLYVCVCFWDEHTTSTNCEFYACLGMKLSV
jgi:hypothetical protein